MKYDIIFYFMAPTVNIYIYIHTYLLTYLLIVEMQRYSRNTYVVNAMRMIRALSVT